MTEFIDFRNDENESDIHINAKNIITCQCIDNSITLTNHLNEKLKIEPSDIKIIIQEFTWYIKQENPRKSFSADVCIIDTNDNILAIIEVVKTNKLSIAKYNFYQSLNIFWLELAAEHIISEEKDFRSSFTYNFHLDQNFNNKIYLTELEIDKTQNNTKQLILNKITKINKQLKTYISNEKKIQLVNEKDYLIEKISSPYIIRKQKAKQRGLNKIQQFKTRIKELKIERRQLKETNQDYKHINQEINKLRIVIERIKGNHLSNRQQKLREKNINDAKRAKQIRKIILTTNSKLVIDIFNQLERISKNTQSNSISYDMLFQIFYTNKKFSNKLSNIQLKQLERLGWTLSQLQFQKLS